MCQQQQDCLWLTGGGVDRFCKLRFETGKCLCTDESRMNNKTGACYAEQESMIAIWSKFNNRVWYCLLFTHAWEEVCMLRTRIYSI